MRTWNKVAIIGVGLIGGSIGLALRERRLASRVVGIGRRNESLQKGIARGCVTEITTSIAEGVNQAELVAVCSPVESIAEHVLEVCKHCGERCVVTDAGSTKRQIVAEVEAKLASQSGDRMSFVGSHPLAGSEQSGPESADGTLFKDRVVVITPTKASRSDAVAAVEEFWQSLGARTVQMTPQGHDEAIACTSHLPHLIASALAAATPEQLLPLTASGWQDTTRIAAGDAELWRQILFANRDSILKGLADFETVLNKFRTALETADGALLAELLAEGKRRRDAVGS